MYWPIGTPEAFEQGIPEDSSVDELHATNYGLGREEEEPSDSSPVEFEQGQHAPVTVALRDEASSRGNGEIIAIRVARAGHILVTITDRTLTIWQVKVRQASFGTQSYVTNKSAAHRSPNFDCTITIITEYAWLKCRGLIKARCCHYRFTNLPRIPHHIFTKD